VQAPHQADGGSGPYDQISIHIGRAQYKILDVQDSGFSQDSSVQKTQDSDRRAQDLVKRTRDGPGQS
jgi:hypothetical protein